MNPAKKRVVKVASMEAGAKAPADTAVRVARMEAYMKRTHQAFLVNLKMTDELRISAHGVLAGPVAKRAGVIGGRFGRGKGAQ